MNNKTDIDVQYVSPLKKICMTIGELPSSYLETMSYYEMLVWFTEFLKNQVIPTVNNNAEAVQELQSLYEELRTYVNNYFDNLDVQEEINNKLDEMAESGQLTDIIAQYLGLAGMIAFDTVADMKASQNLVNGSKCKTLGFYAVNDGGSATYKIRAVTNEDVIDEASIIALYDNTLIAELIFDENINVKQFGAKGDGITDDHSTIQKAINKNRGKIIFPKGNYLIKNQLILKDCDYIGYDAEIWVDNSIENEEYFIYNENFLNNELKNSFTINGINFKCNLRGTGSNYIVCFKNIKNVKIENCKFYTPESLDGTTHLLDLRCNSEDVLIRNCEFYINETDATTRATTLLIRNYQGDQYSYTNNITVDNCNFTKNCQDETVWVNADCGLVNNVVVKNCNINDIATASNTVWIGATESGKITNSELRYCKIYKEYLKTRLVTLGYQVNETDNPEINNVSINDCEITINDTDDTIYTYVILSDYDVSTNISANNTKITYAGTKKLAGCFWNIDTVRNCNVDISTSTDNCIFLNVNNVYGGKYKSSGNVSNTTINVYDAEINCRQFILVPASSTGTRTINLINSKITSSGKIIVMSYNTSIINVIFKNCIIKNSSGISDFYSVSNSSDSTISLINTDISNDQLIYSNKPKLVLSNITINGLVLRGIPSQGNTRGACEIGTLIPAATNDTTHTFVKKISDGDLESNWSSL